MRLLISLMFLTVVFSPLALSTSGFHLEVMETSGEARYGPSFENTRPLLRGNLIPHGYFVTVPKNHSVDLSFDPQWENIMHIVGPASMMIHSVFPTEIHMDFGDIYSLLPALPTQTSHEIRTPLAVATVHGSEYRVTHFDKTTTVSNFSASPVFVFGRKVDFDLFKDPLVLKPRLCIRKSILLQVLGAYRLKKIGSVPMRYIPHFLKPLHTNYLQHNKISNA